MELESIQPIIIMMCVFPFTSEKDYPPVARAGNDVVIVLPVDHVTLYANGSTDDKVLIIIRTSNNY